MLVYVPAIWLVLLLYINPWDHFAIAIVWVFKFPSKAYVWKGLVT